mgnify:CR=1 FL=1
MRAMLGYGTDPCLLVDVEGGNYPAEFQFWVVNGAWEGYFNNGHITVNAYPNDDHLNGVSILCDNQDRLRGEYQDVFDNFDNPEYVAPKYDFKPLPDDWDDDIPF